MKRTVVSTLLASLIVFGCGDDDSASDTQAFCDVMARGHETGAPPDAEGFKKLEELAPTEIRDDVSRAADLFRQKGSDVIDDPEFQRIDVAVEDWEAENCPGADQTE